MLHFAPCMMRTWCHDVSWHSWVTRLMTSEGDKRSLSCMLFQPCEADGANNGQSLLERVGLNESGGVVGIWCGRTSPGRTSTGTSVSHWLPTCYCRNLLRLLHGPPRNRPRGYHRFSGHFHRPPLCTSRQSPVKAYFKRFRF